MDQSALTGESLPVTMFAGDSCKMGSTVTRGEVEGTVESTGTRQGHDTDTHTHIYTHVRAHTHTHTSPVTRRAKVS